jgi:hypothetical protein
MEKLAPPLLPLHPPMLSNPFYNSSNNKKRDLSYDVVHIPNDNWNPKEWNWDSIRFTAKSTVSQQQHSEETLKLNLGGVSGGVNGGGVTNRANKRVRSGSPTASYPMCQVDNCKEDLSKAKDYHRRHKVCEAHSKASKALLGNQMQRFCQQCSRFHPLLEFDEGKRSCRRRLAGHNRRRRKTQPDEVATSSSPPLNQQVVAAAANLEIFNLLTAIADGSQGMGYVKACLVS